MSIQQDIMQAIDGIFSLSTVNAKDKKLLKQVQTEIDKMTEAAREAFAEFMLHYQLPEDNSIVLYFYLYDCFRDVRFLDKVLDYLPSKLTVPAFYEYYWNFSQRLFTSNSGSKKINEALRDRFQLSTDALRKFMLSRGLLRKVTPYGSPKKIAILSPQILNMRHSPTREAFSVALHLEKYHGCECYVFNTNAMNYEEGNNLGLVSYSQFFKNDDLLGAQKINVKYMQFDSQVNLVSFPAEVMTTQKIAGIVNTLYQLNVDAVISHGDNLMVMETLYGSIPSLFATTGTVVPYNHCDAYFIPGHLFSESAQHQASIYGHSNFMMESMLVTPEGVSEKPASRSEFNLVEDNFVFLVVGTRLNAEIDWEFAAVCTSLLASNTNTRILFAGTPDLQLEKFFESHLIETHTVQNIGFQDDLPAISAMCNCYLNPRRNGGGTSSQTSIINNLPVVTLDVGHISAIVPSDMRHENWQEYETFAVKLRESEVFLENVVNQLKQHYYKELDSRGQIQRIYEQLCYVSSDEFAISA